MGLLKEERLNILQCDGIWITKIDLMGYGDDDYGGYDRDDGVCKERSILLLLYVVQTCRWGFRDDWM